MEFIICRQGVSRNTLLSCIMGNEVFLELVLYYRLMARYLGFCYFDFDHFLFFFKSVSYEFTYLMKVLW